MKYLLISLLFIFAPALCAHADEAPVEAQAEAGEDEALPQKGPAKRLEEVVVTATRTERTTEEVPAAVTAVSREDIKNTRMFGVSEALGGIAGVQAETKNGGYDSRLIIRGAGLKARYGIREIMVLLDGVPITDPDGMTRLDFVDTQLVDRVDVVKGPNSTLYGANAVGGVINIISKSPFEESSTAKAAYGSYNTQMYNLGYSNRIGETYFTVSGSRRSTDSWREWNKFSTNQASLKAGHLFGDGTTVEGSFNYTRAYFQLPGALTREEYNDNIKQRTSEPWRHSVRNSEIFYTNIRMETEIGNVKLKPLAYFESWNHFHPVTGLINDGGADVYGADIQADVGHRLFGGDATLTMGVSGQVDDASGDKFQYRDVATNIAGRILYTLSNTPGALAETSEDTTTKWGVYAQESFRPADRWLVDMGVRYDQVRFDIHTEQFTEYSYGAGRYIVNRATVKRAKTFDSVSPRIGVVYRLLDWLHMYGNFSTGFQTPQSSELGDNPDLDPMTVYNHETGLKARSERGDTADLSVFHMSVDDEIVQTIEAGNISTYSNAGKTEKFGVELSGRLKVTDGLFIGGAYTYSRFKFKEFSEPVRVGPVTVLMDRSGNRLPYIPEHQYSLFADYRHPSGFKFRVDTSTWGRYFVDNANTQKYKGYALITNAIVGYEYKGLDLTFSVNNLFDTKYAMEVTKDSTGALRFRPGSPLTLMAQAVYNF